MKLREDIKHLSAKHKKLTDKLAKDTAKTKAMIPMPSLQCLLTAILQQTSHVGQLIGCPPIWLAKEHSRGCSEL